VVPKWQALIPLIGMGSIALVAFAESAAWFSFTSCGVSRAGFGESDLGPTLIVYLAHSETTPPIAIPGPDGPRIFVSNSGSLFSFQANSL
jgi:hypothetical protein